MVGGSKRCDKCALSDTTDFMPYAHTILLSPQLEISEGGTLNAQALKQIKAGGDGVGLRTYDPG
jgi:hypothetical protein